MTQRARRGEGHIDDERHCARIVRAHARAFALASLFLPAPKRRAAYALYAFCRVADDIVDRATATPDPTLVDHFAAYGAKLDAALAGTPSDAVFRELTRAVAAYRIPVSTLRALLAGIARDLEPARYRSWCELARYCDGVASTVGEMCTYIFGVQGGDAAHTSALGYARVLGVAMQLTNILRDVGEDARRGRCYLPEEDLDRFDLGPSDVLGAASGPLSASDPRWRGFMAFEVDRARELYRAAAPGIALLAPDAQRCAAACAMGYAAILDAIEEIGYDSLARRAIPTSTARASVLWASFRTRQIKGIEPRGDAAPPADDAAPLSAPTELIEWA